MELDHNRSRSNGPSVGKPSHYIDRNDKQNDNVIEYNKSRSYSPLDQNNRHPN